MCNIDFQGAMQLFFKKQSHLNGMNLTQVFSGLLGKFGMQKRKLLQIPNMYTNIDVMGNLLNHFQ